MTDIVKRLTEWTIDWNGSRMVDGEPPRDGLHCDELREAAAEITSLRKHIEDLDDLQTILDEQLDKYTAALAEAREVIKDNSCSCGIICKHGNLTPNYCPSHRAARWMEKHK